MRAHLLTLALLFALPLSAQEVPPTPSNIAGFGPLDAAQPTGITVPQIIERMGEREASFEHARNQYTFRQTVKMDTISDDTGKPDGEFADVEDITFDNAGHRVEHVVFAPGNTLERVIMTETDVNDIKQRLPFILTTAQLPEYNLTYTGKQRVDTLDTFVLDVAPKQLVKGHRYFQGKVWVDQQDMEIVLVNGMNVPQDVRKGHEDLSPPFTTYYQQIDGKYWFPTYTRAEGVLHFAAQNGALSQEVHMRDTVRYTEYKRYHTSVTIEYAGQDIPSETGDPSGKQPATPSTPAPQPKP
ncbi:MAG: hypothetical protein ACRYFU_20315 [Janthinobacterium lividum]